MTILALKLVLTPLLIAVASLVQRRFGGRVGGLVAGLPLTSAPVSVFISLKYGSALAAKAAVATLLGVVAMSGFCTAYALCARRLSWPPSLALAAFTCAAITITLSRVPQNLVLAAAIAFPKKPNSIFSRSSSLASAKARRSSSGARRSGRQQEKSGQHSPWSFGHAGSPATHRSSCSSLVIPAPPAAHSFHLPRHPCASGFRSSISATPVLSARRKLRCR